MFSDNKKGKDQALTDFSRNQNKISEGTKIVGDVISEGGFRVEGTIEGTFKTTGKVVVGKSGFIQGTLECSDADFEGKFSGNLIISGTLSLKPTAHIEGEVSVGKLAVEPGATFNASCVMKGGVKSLGGKQDGQKQGQQGQGKSA
ncbi:polymer-forming cytoskeletal protein [Aquimarina sp. BL5]|uniref:bactofilin family protein n=1 Tax=Aquimarina sp. BL5 TaxID=1714860 RepID=UPI000E48D201|nr:polymer-forming cytoskeletal protein [Aquimarina sp. BL5]AXT51947.1 polymer-forming cytoskeletal protein [Aquimarina sp. BL5]RKN03950.1 polymer-forming cytoskeletal protein [Aquimarina sp. BL5]